MCIRDRLGALAMGSCATIGTTVNLFAPLFHRVRDAFDRGDMAQAYRWQHAINLRVEETVKLGILDVYKRQHMHRCTRPAGS